MRTGDRKKALNYVPNASFDTPPPERQSESTALTHAESKRWVKEFDEKFSNRNLVSLFRCGGDNFA